MYQIDVQTAAPTLPSPAAPGTPGYFTDGNLAGGLSPTIVPADFLNALMLEMLNVVTAGGVSPGKTTNNQVLLAIQNLIEARSGNYALDTGAVNAFVIALSPAVTAYGNGLQVKFRATHANTGAANLNAGGGVKALLRDDGAALQAGDVPNGGLVAATFDTAAGAFLLNSVVPSQFGTIAKLNIGAGLLNDGAGNLSVNTASQASDQYFYGQL